MNDTPYLFGLNAAQKEAVLHENGPLLIVAGAGAGKTKTITHRIAGLVERGVPAHKILGLTFTNKAAAEMRERVRDLVPRHKGMPLVSTFHSLAVRLLREFGRKVGVEDKFSIFDRDDQLRAMKRALRDKGVDDENPRYFLGAISKEKGRGVSAIEHADKASSPKEHDLSRAWLWYEDELKKAGALDFDDLLLKVFALLTEHADVRELLQNRWQHIVIDEYQDTNSVQFEITRLLAGNAQNLSVVGDLDQCLSEDTKVRMANDDLKDISTVKEGDVVLANHGSGRLAPATILRVRSKRYTGEMVRINTRGGRTLTSTPEHIHFAGYRLGKTPQLYFTYLMHKRGKGWRLGVSQVYTRGQRAPMLGFQQRCNHEHADNVWIIAAHERPNDARVLECTLSLKYGIPTLPFVARKTASGTGYVHDQETLDKIFASFDTETSAKRLLDDFGLSLFYPHHRAQAARSSRRNINITLCAERRGLRAMHRISMAGMDREGSGLLRSVGISIRPAKSSAASWRFESAHRELSAAHAIAEKIHRAIPDASIVESARLGGQKSSPKDGNSLPLLPAGSIRQGMVVFEESTGFDVIERIDRIFVTDATVYDLDIDGVHNFIANGIFTHNCIYTWRQARLENLLSFERSFPGTKTVRLEDNYRSTATIIRAANGVIEKNTNRIPKTLRAMREVGEPIYLFDAREEQDEAWFVALTAQKLIAKGVPPNDIAVLYRDNFQSRVLEEAFLSVGIPYRVIGTRFFERKEVKDVLAYVRAALRGAKGPDLSRIISTPPRGIGATTLQKMLAGKENELPSSMRAKITAFHASLDKMRIALETLPLSEAIRFVLEHSGLERMYKLAKEKEEAEHYDNVRELVNLAVRYDKEESPRGAELLLEEAALQSDQDELQEEDRSVSLMTIHASKGLEFDTVFLTGLEQGLLPSLRLDEDTDPEEERRLFYVALTRAKTRLFLTYARTRLRYGSREMCVPSEFLSDIDERLLSSVSLEAEEPVIE